MWFPLPSIRREEYIVYHQMKQTLIYMHLNIKYQDHDVMKSSTLHTAHIFIKLLRTWIARGTNHAKNIHQVTIKQ